MDEICELHNICSACPWDLTGNASVEMCTLQGIPGWSNSSDITQSLAWMWPEFREELWDEAIIWFPVPFVFKPCITLYENLWWQGIRSKHCTLLEMPLFFLMSRLDAPNITCYMAAFWKARGIWDIHHQGAAHEDFMISFSDTMCLIYAEKSHLNCAMSDGQSHNRDRIRCFLDPLWVLYFLFPCWIMDELCAMNTAILPALFILVTVYALCAMEPWWSVWIARPSEDWLPRLCLDKGYLSLSDYLYQWWPQWEQLRWPQDLPKRSHPHWLHITWISPQIDSPCPIITHLSALLQMISFYILQAPQHNRSTKMLFTTGI